MHWLALVTIGIAVVLALVFHNLSTKPTTTDSHLGSGEFFDAVADYYDITNAYMSLGLDMSWRRELVRAISLSQPEYVLDIATGTGDVACLVAVEMKKFGRKFEKIIGLDPSNKMLSYAALKAEEKSLNSSITFIHGDVQDMNLFQDDRFTKITMSFGIRNVPNRTKGLEEIKRVLKPGGVVAIMEFVTPRHGMFAPLARYFIKFIVPLIGSLSSQGLVKEYNHLRDSILNFPSPEEFVSMMLDVGFVDCTASNIAFDAIYIFKCKV